MGGFWNEYGVYMYFFLSHQLLVWAKFDQNWNKNCWKCFTIIFHICETLHLRTFFLSENRHFQVLTNPIKMTLFSISLVMHVYNNSILVTPTSHGLGVKHCSFENL